MESIPVIEAKCLLVKEKWEEFDTARWPLIVSVILWLVESP
jgi:hypothetical protein